MCISDLRVPTYRRFKYSLSLSKQKLRLEGDFTLNLRILPTLQSDSCTYDYFEVVHRHRYRFLKMLGNYKKKSSL